MLIYERDRPSASSQTVSAEVWTGQVTQVATLVGAVSLVPPGVVDLSDEEDIDIDDGLYEEQNRKDGENFNMEGMDDENDEVGGESEGEEVDVDECEEGKKDGGYGEDEVIVW